MLTGLKVSSLTCKSLLYRPEHNAEEGSFGLEFWRTWNTEMKYINRQSSKSSWENWFIYLVIMFTPIAMVIKMSKMAHVLYFLLMTIKNSHSRNKSSLEISDWFLLESGIVKVLRYHEIMRIEIYIYIYIKKRSWANKKYQYSVFLTVDMLLILRISPYSVQRRENADQT